MSENIQESTEEVTHFDSPVPPDLIPSDFTESVQETVDGGEFELDLKEVRKNQWKKAIEADLQRLIVDAAKLRKCITEAKTKTKKDFYTKKFNKVSAYVRQYVAALQRLGAPVLPEGTDNEHDTTEPTNE